MLIGNINTVKARKEHSCNWCGIKIQVGEYYGRSFNKHDGDVYTWKNHLYCEKISQKLNMWDDYDEGLTEDNFCESIDIEYSEIMRNDETTPIPDFKERLIVVLDKHNIEHRLNK